MSLLILMYHRARAGRHGNAPEMLDAHFAHIARRHACVLPGEPLNSARLNVCLTFDDAYFDFYAIVFPLLGKHSLRAVLAVPPIVVSEHAVESPAERLRVEADVNSSQSNPGGFCTWTELHEMTQSGRVMVAAHGFTHCRLDRETADLHKEIAGPQNLLAARLGQPVDTFVFPYGRFTRAALTRVRRTYRYAFRIGGADNRGWAGSPLYRVDADRMSAADALFTTARRNGYRVRYLWNRLRGR
ncbi:MAG: polysaccharide deacetylase family protein [Opitutaceae bacterium]